MCPGRIEEEFAEEANISSCSLTGGGEVVRSWVARKTEAKMPDPFDGTSHQSKLKNEPNSPHDYEDSLREGK